MYEKVNFNINYIFILHHAGNVQRIGGMGAYSAE